ncbi:MAG: DUF433 domain-containing protein, partial [Candidatus Promineofilum sp.]|nr:DUF433 domain-containing protein [Promineifilum sp.]
FMAIFTTMTIESKHVGPLYAGTAVGFAFAFSSAGNLVAPPVGNSLATLWPGAPFAFWALLAVLGFVCLAMVRERERDVDPAFPHVTYRRGAAGIPTPILRGTGIRVQTIVIAHEQWEMSAADIAAEYDLSPEQVKAALAFFATHRVEIETHIAREEQLAQGSHG